MDLSDPHQRKKLVSHFSWLCFLALGIYILYQFLTQGWQSVSPLAWILFIPYAPLVALMVTGPLGHEIGHGVAAYLAGMKVYSISIGTHGATIFWARAGQLDLIVREYPLDGFVHAEHPSRRFLRLRELMMVLGGPLANAVMVVAAIEVFFAREMTLWSLEGYFTLLITINNLGCLALSLYPRKMQMGHGAVESDGLALVTIPFMREDQCTARHAAYFVAEGCVCRDRGQPNEAVNWLQRGLELYPDDSSLNAWLGTVYRDLYRFHDARDVFRRLLDRGDLSADVECWLWDSVASAALFTGDRDYLPEADTYSRKLMEARPSDVAAQETRGAVLVELDQIEEGLAMLRHALEQETEPRARALVECYIALALAKQGQGEQAAEHLASARDADPTCIVMRRVEEEWERRRASAVSGAC